MAIRFSLITITPIAIGETLKIDEAMNCGMKLANKKSVVNRNAKNSFGGMNCDIMNVKSGFRGTMNLAFSAYFLTGLKAIGRTDVKELELNELFNLRSEERI
jgi:hypothetical protein